MSQRKRTNSYWKKRSEERLLTSEKNSLRYLKRVEKIYRDAERNIQKEILKLYDKCYQKDQGFNKKLLDLIVSEKDNRALVIKIEKLGLTNKVPDNYKGRLTRLEHLNKQIWTEIKELAKKQENLETLAHRETFEQNYYNVGYDVSRGIGSTPISFSTLDWQTINQILGTRFEGRNYSERIWINTDILANQLKDRLAVAVATGQSIEKTSREIRDRFGVAGYYAKRLIRTETNYFHNRGEIEAYKNLGFEKFTFLATLDNRTSEICAGMDGKTFDISRAESGVNVPPLHPNCRSTIIPAFKGYEPKTRRYRDPETGRNKYIYNLSYTEWRKTLKNDKIKV